MLSFALTMLMKGCEGMHMQRTRCYNFMPSLQHKLVWSIRGLVDIVVSFNTAGSRKTKAMNKVRGFIVMQDIDGGEMNLPSFEL
jgi:hypothetical protein